MEMTTILKHIDAIDPTPRSVVVILAAEPSRRLARPQGEVGYDSE